MHLSQPPEIHPDQETEELVHFRETWKAEIRQKKANSAPSPVQTVPSLSHAPGPGSPLLHRKTPQDIPQVACSAVEIYRRAVELERRSQLDDALRLYRQVRKCRR
jgi:F-box protein 9